MNIPICVAGGMNDKIPPEQFHSILSISQYKYIVLQYLEMQLLCEENHLQPSAQILR